MVVLNIACLRFYFCEYDLTVADIFKFTQQKSHCAHNPSTRVNRTWLGLDGIDCVLITANICMFS